ncbi:MAG: response regulator [Xanthobacteraceae bacterium]
MSGPARMYGASGTLLEAPKTEQPRPPAARVLVIDSDNLHRMIMCRAADKAGYIPAGAANVAEATKLVRSAQFDCITLDLSLGRQAVGDMLRCLSAFGCEARIFFIGNHNAAEGRGAVRLATLLDLNVGEPVAKPVDVGMLRYALEQLKIQGALARGLAAVGV